MRVNPRYFYPVDAFTGEAESVNYSSITIWDEIIPKTLSAQAVDYDTDYKREKYRPLFYDLPAAFADLVGREAYRDWHSARSQEERDNECVAVSFIKYFNITESDFIMASEKRQQFLASIGISMESGSTRDVYPVDLIFTLDNELINNFYLWENNFIISEYAQEK